MKIMEKWVRNLSQTTALIIAIVSLFFTAVFVIFVNNNIGNGNGFLPAIIGCAVLGGCIGFSFLFLFKASPEKRRSKRRNRRRKNKIRNAAAISSFGGDYFE